MNNPSAIYECMRETNGVFVLKACDWPWNLIEPCKPKLSRNNDRYAQIGAMQPLETHSSDVLDNQEVGLILYLTCFSLSVWSCSSGSDVHDKDESPYTHLTYWNLE